MRIKAIGCEVLAREIYYCASRSCNIVWVHLLPQGLHDNPEEGKKRIQKEIDSTSSDKYDVIVLVYGLCSNIIEGISSKKLKIVIPRAHDCITLLLGSRQKYNEYFSNYPGCYYYTPGWLEWELKGGNTIGYTQKSGLKEIKYNELAEKYGEENAKFILECMKNWVKLSHYTHGMYIELDFVEHLNFEFKAKNFCKQKNLEFLKVKGDLRLIQNLFDGNWNNEEFLILEPGEKVKPKVISSEIITKDK